MTTTTNSTAAIDRASNVMMEALSELSPDVPLRVVNDYTADIPSELPSVWIRITRAEELEDGGVAFSAELAAFLNGGLLHDVIPPFDREHWGKLSGDTFGEIRKDAKAYDRWDGVKANSLPLRGATLPGGAAVSVIDIDAIATAPGERAAQGPKLTPYGYILQREDGSVYHMTEDEIRHRFHMTGRLPKEFLARSF